MPLMYEATAFASSSVNFEAMPCMIALSFVRSRIVGGSGEPRPAQQQRRQGQYRGKTVHA